MRRISISVFKIFVRHKFKLEFCFAKFILSLYFPEHIEPLSSMSIIIASVSHQGGLKSNKGGWTMRFPEFRAEATYVYAQKPQIPLTQMKC